MGEEGGGWSYLRLAIIMIIIIFALFLLVSIALWPVGFVCYLQIDGAVAVDVVHPKRPL